MKFPFSKNKKEISDAERQSRAFANMSAKEHKRLMKSVIERASQEQIRVIKEAERLRFERSRE